MSGTLPQSESEKPELKIVLVGKTGVGKTSVMNTLMGREPPVRSVSASSETTECKRETREFADYKLVIIDTPGMLHTEKTKEEVEKNIMETIVHAAPGVHMFLLVMKPQALSVGDIASVKIIQEMFGENTKDYTLALFTKGDTNRLSQEDITAAGIKNFSVDWHTFDNTKKNTIPDQVPELLEKINSIVRGREEKKKMYSNEMFEKAQEIKEEVQKKMREEQEKQGEKQEGNEEGILKATVEAILSLFVGEKNSKTVLFVVSWIQNTVEACFKERKNVN